MPENTTEDAEWKTLKFDDGRLSICVTPVDDPDTLVVKLAGKVETDNSPAASAELKRVFSFSRQPRTIILETGELIYASSTGIGVMAAILIESQKQGIQLRIANMNQSVKKIFDLLGFSSFFTFIQWP